MGKVPFLNDAQLEEVSRLLGDCTDKSGIDNAFIAMKIEDMSGLSTKWRRIKGTFEHYQQRDGAASKLIDFIKILLAPVKYVDKNDDFKDICQKLNMILAFAGLEYGEDGKFSQVTAAKTIDEAQKRCNTLKARFKGRRIHPEVTKYCKSELLQENYFHAVFEATKGLAQKIRNMSGVDADGAALVDKVFLINQPVLGFNKFETETEKSMHRGFASLLKGCFTAIRNPRAHEPKLLWINEDDADDAADYFSFISLLHRKLDGCTKTNWGGKS